MMKFIEDLTYLNKLREDYTSKSVWEFVYEVKMSTYLHDSYRNSNYIAVEIEQYFKV